MNHSPWIAQLNAEREIHSLQKDSAADVVVVGGGIAGIATAFFLLTRTDRTVILLEASKVAHGATGHNAGQVTSYFERGFASIVREFGLEQARDGQKAVEDAWILLDEMYTMIRSDIPFARFTGHAGLSTEAQVLLHLENNFERVRAGLVPEQFLIAHDAPFVSRIPERYQGLYRLVSHNKILDMIESHNPIFVAVISFQKGCINSALFCQEVLLWMRQTYADRFSCFEHAHVQKVVLHETQALLDVGTYVVAGSRVVLCTNGFDTVDIFDRSGLAIDNKFRHSVEGVVGYMSAYLEPVPDTPMAASYLLQPDPTDPFFHPDEATGDPYFLITRRPYQHTDIEQTLISVAGPEVKIKERHTYSRETEFPTDATASIDRFVRSSYESDATKDISYLFTWHGLMGYTPNGIRLIGPEPRNAVLIYNLGCNGVGILPSIYGAQRIARLIKGEKLAPSIFDPQ